MKTFASLLMVAFGCGVTSIAVPAQADPLKHPAMQLFLAACAIPYTHLELVMSEMRLQRFTEVTGADLSRYQVGGLPSRAWRGVIDGAPYAVALSPERLCTVIVYEGNAEAIHAAVESWLPTAAEGIAVKKQSSEPRDGRTTITYELRGGQVREQWAVTISRDPKSHIRALLSWTRLPAA